MRQRLLRRRYAGLMLIKLATLNHLKAELQPLVLMTWLELKLAEANKLTLCLMLKYTMIEMRVCVYVCLRKRKSYQKKLKSGNKKHQVVRVAFLKRERSSGSSEKVL